MPSVDSTGKRIGGAEQARRAAENNAKRAKLAAAAPELAAALPEFRTAAAAAVGGAGKKDKDDPEPIGIEPPPYSTVGEGVTWAARLQVLAAQHAAAGKDPARVRAVGAVVKAIGAVKTTAADSERAVTVAAAYLGLSLDCTGDEPPIEPAGYVLWAFHRLCNLAHSTATTPDEVSDAEVAHRAKALVLVSVVQPQREIDDLAARGAEAAAAAQVPVRAVA